MKALIVYESMYGNTHAVAEAVAAGLGGEPDVELCTTDEATAARVAAADLVLVGGPTHVHGMASSTSREGAIKEAAKKSELDLDPAVESESLRAWFDALDNVGGTSGVAFDTRASGPSILTGSAAKGIAKRMRKHGFNLVAGPESFIVKESGGPLEEGELDRALEWGRTLAAANST